MFYRFRFMLKSEDGGVMEKRWYDSDPLLSLAISLLKNATKTERGECSAYIISYCQKNGFELDTGIARKFECFLKRWYDNDDAVSEVLDYIKIASEEERKNIVTEIIQFLQNSVLQK